MSKNEQTLVDRFSSGDTTAFQELVEQYKKKMYYIAYDITGDHHEAEDISQEVFIKVYRSLKNFRKDAKMSSWLYQITVNASIDSLRKKSSKPHSQTDNLDKINFQDAILGKGAFTHAPERIADAQLMQQHISLALQKVTPRERSVFVLRHYNDLKTKEISEALNISQGAVKAFLFRAIRKLRKELSPYVSNSGLEATYE